MINNTAVHLGRPAPRLRQIAFLMMGLMATWCAQAHVQISIDPFGDAEAHGVDVLDLPTITVAILGSEHLNPRAVSHRNLRLGSRDGIGARPKYRGKKLVDVNHDGFDDRLLVFRTANTSLRKGVHTVGVLRGNLVDGEEFKALDSVVGSDPVDSCLDIDNGLGIIGVQCSFIKSLAPLDLVSLIGDINAELAETTNLKIDDSTIVAVEAWGGKGHKGNKEECTYDNDASPGDGGARGYSKTAQTVADLYDLSANSESLYLYAGEDGPDNQAGGSSSILIGQDLTASSSQTPAEANVVVIAAAGGGGGKGHCSNDTAYGGYHGGNGATAQASTGGADSAAGDDAAQNHAGGGGNSDQGGKGGSGGDDGDDGKDGVGGFGSKGLAGFNGSSLTTGDWSEGEGGEGGNGESGGGGGGGFGGGGGGGGNKDHKGGGGGGGGWATQATVAASQFDSGIVLGPSFDPGIPQVTITFQVVDLSD